MRKVFFAVSILSLAAMAISALHGEPKQAAPAGPGPRLALNEPNGAPKSDGDAQKSDGDVPPIKPVITPTTGAPAGAPASGQGPNTSVTGSDLPILEPELPTGGMGPRVSAPFHMPNVSRPPHNWIDQSRESAHAKSVGCMECHRATDRESMHTSENVILGCTDCHGGDPKRGLTIEQAHVPSKHPEFWKSSANPPNANVVLNHETPEFIRFINPGDLRVAQQACGLCHGDIVKRVSNSIMRHGAMLWNAAGYNNGAVPLKNPIVGQAYGPYGTPLELDAPFFPTPEETRLHGWLPLILPLPRFNYSQPGNVFRIFEKGGMAQLSLGSPTLDEPPGKPERRLSDRGMGTLLRTDPIILGAQKTRFHDPLLDFFGTNDHPGDYRSSGCSACHVVYANDRSPSNSGFWHRFGNQGLSFTKDPTIHKNERGHPIFHEFTRSIPSAMCMNCHHFQGNLFVNPFLGYIWWDEETDGEVMYPKKQHDPTDDELVMYTRANPEAAAGRGKWHDLDFLEHTAELNPQLKHTQFADYHSHGWVFRAIFKHDRKGNLMDLNDNKVPFGDFKHAVHLKDIHLQKGMQCVDCHFEVEVHGNGLLYGEPRNQTTITCVDCHGTVEKRATLITAGAGGTWDGKSHKTESVNLATLSTPFGPRFEWRDVLDAEGKATVDAAKRPVRRLYQYSTMESKLSWEVPQVLDVVDPTSPRYNVKGAYAMTMHRDGETWGKAKLPDTSEKCEAELAHSNQKMDCQICHSSWVTSCFGCHLSMKANQHVPLNKYEGVVDRNFTTYNPQVMRDDIFQLGLDGTVKKNRLAVLRSSSAPLVSSQNSNREWVYFEMQPVSGGGYSGQAYNPHFPHTTSGVGTTKACTDCHLSKANDNNAWMASLFGYGTGTVNFFGPFAWVGGKGGLHAVVWTETEEPQAPFGSHFQEMAYPRNFDEHLKRGRVIKTAYEHHANVINDLTVRAEYLYTASGTSGLEIYDIANIDQKGFSERFVTSPVSPLGQRTYVRTKYATSVALPSTLSNDSKRLQLAVNEEQPIGRFYGYVYVTDLVEGLVIVNVETLFDGDPENNFLYRTKLRDESGKDSGKTMDHFNPDGRLTGAAYGVCAGYHMYICVPDGLEVVNLKDPEAPRLVGSLGSGYLHNPKAVAIQYRYAFVTDDEGLKVLDISNPTHPRPIPKAFVPLSHAGKLYVARTYAYVADGPDGLAIIDVENPERPHVEQMFTANGQLNDVRAVQIGSVAASMYALVADGKNGFRVIQMISPDTVEGAAGFSPRPAPRLIASYPTSEPALAVSRGLDRDRITDETDGQTVVFGRRGSRPLHRNETMPFVKHSDGSWYKVEDVRREGNRLFTKNSGVELKDTPMPGQPAAPASPAPAVTTPPPASDGDVPPLTPAPGEKPPTKAKPPAEAPAKSDGDAPKSDGDAPKSDGDAPIKPDRRLMPDAGATPKSLPK